MKENGGFKQLYYKGIPIELRDDLPIGVIYFKTTDPPRLDINKVWAMRCLANDLEGKKTWPWAKLIWRIKIFLGFIKKGDKNV